MYNIIYIRMAKKQLVIEGGKIKSSKQINREIRKGFKKHIEKPIDKAIIKPVENQVLPALGEMGWMLGDATNKYILPTVKTIGIPMASTVAGMAGNYLGGPIAGELTGKLSNSLMKEYIPGQSKNKYIGMIGDAMGQALGGVMTGSSDPIEAMNLGEKFLGTASNDVIKPRKARHDPDNPYDTFLSQMLNMYDNDYIDTNTPPNWNWEDMYTPEEVAYLKARNNPIDDPRDDNDAIYKDDELGPNADSIIQKYPPYQQMEGSMRGLLGAGVKKRRGRPKKQDVVMVDVIEKLPHQRYAHSKNASLDQYLYNTKLKKDKVRQKNIDELIKRQLNANNY